MSAANTPKWRDQATAFEDADVVAHYHLRARYPAVLFDRIYAKAPAFGHAIDLGCGTGKMTGPLMQRFDHVTAVDPSAAMLREAQRRVRGQVTWLHGKAEDVALPLGADLVSFGESIHWMDHSRLFPRLRTVLNDRHLVAVVTGGDAAHAPDWQDVWHAFLEKWVLRLTGRPVDFSKRSEFWAGHEEQLVDLETVEIPSAVRQPLTEFVETQFSRSTFARSRLGAYEAEFAAELTQMLTPFADGTGCLSFETKSTLTLARLKPGEMM